MKKIFSLFLLLAICTLTVKANVTNVNKAVTGPTFVCAGSTIQLSDPALSGGTWKSLNTSVATVNSAGLVKGVAGGTVTITHSASGYSSTINITVNALPTVAAISGASYICKGSTIQLTDVTVGGVWSSNNPQKATVDSNGVVTGLGASNNVTISDTITDNNTGCKNAATKALIIYDLPTYTSIKGTSTICANASTTLTNGTSGGVWTSSNTTAATVNANTGVVSGVAGGSTTITYTYSDAHCSNNASLGMTINPLPDATITGSNNLCKGSTTNLTAASAGGVWISSNTAVATINSSGIVTGVAAGVVTISYSATNGCGTSTGTLRFTVNDVPVITSQSTAAATYCQNDVANALAVNATGSGLSYQWYTNTSSSNSRGTLISGVTTASYTPTTGTAGSSYYYCVISNTNNCSVSSAVSGLITINALPTITSQSTVAATYCQNDAANALTVTATGSALSYQWYSNTVSNNSGGALISGATTASYIPTTGNVGSNYYYCVVLNTNNCSVTSGVSGLISVNGLPTVNETIGSSNVFLDSSIIFLNSTSGGVWSSADTSIVKINLSGKATGKGVGTANIIYSITDNQTGCIGKSVNSLKCNSQNIGNILINNNDSVLSNLQQPILSPSVQPGSGCPYSCYNLISNANFELNVGCGMIDFSTNPSHIKCWNNASYTPDMHTTNCYQGNCSLGIWTIGTNPPVTPVIPGTTGVLGLQANTFSSTSTQFKGLATDAIHQRLSQSLQPGVEYNISFDATVHNDHIALMKVQNINNDFLTSSADCSEAIVRFGSSISPIPYSYFSPLKSQWTELLTQQSTGILGMNGVLIKNTNTSQTMNWKHFGPITFKFNPQSGNPENEFYIGVDINPAVEDNTYVFIDNVVLTPVKVACNLNTNAVTTYCGLPQILNLDNIFTPSIAGGSYTTIINNQVVIVSNPITITNPGTYLYTYHYNLSGCVGEIQLPAITIGESSITGASSVCLNSTVQLQAPIPGGQWAVQGLNVSVTTTGLVTGLVVSSNNIVTYTVSNNLCGNGTLNFPIQVNDKPVVPKISGPTEICMGDVPNLNPFNYTNTSNTGVWSLSNNASNITIGQYNGQMVIATPVAGTYTVYYSVSNQCGTSTNNIDFEIIENPTINTTGQLCENTSPQLNTYNNGNFGIQWYLNGYAMNGQTLPSIYPSTAGSYTVSLVDNNNNNFTCFSKPVNILVAPTVTINSVSSPFCIGLNTNNLSATPIGGVWSCVNNNCINATVNSNGQVTGNNVGTQDVQYSYTDNTSGCTGTAQSTLQINNCNTSYVTCTSNNYIGINNIDINGGVYQNAVYSIQNPITVSTNSTLTFADAEFMMGTNASITVQNGATLIIQGSHLYGCSTMWPGINVEPGGAVKITGTIDHSSFIEDAIVGIKFDFQLLNDQITIPIIGYFLDVDNTIFNRNNISIEIDNYTSNFADGRRPYPFYVKNTVFTSRDIRFVSGNLAWDDVEMIKNVNTIHSIIYPNPPDGLTGSYIDDNLNTYSATSIAAFMKSPYPSLKPYAGIVLNNVGYVDRTGNNQAGIKIGFSAKEPEITNTYIINNLVNTYNTNVFDNMADFGIAATNSNLTVVNNTFQNFYAQTVPDGDDYRDSYQIGIYTGRVGEANTNLYRLSVIKESELPTNAFYNLVYAVRSDMYYNNTISETAIRSTQRMTNDMSPGQFGIWVQTDELGSVDINSNKIYNIYSPIYLYSYIGYYLGNNGVINANGNTIGACPNLPNWNCTGNEKVNTAIALVTGFASNVIPSSNSVNCNGNIIDGAYNGIQISNWKSKPTFINSNRIKLVQNTIPQFGISVESGNGYYIKPNPINNEIYGNTVYCNGNLNSNASGIQMQNNYNTFVGCNTVYGGLNGFYFVGYNGNTTWWDNIMDASNQNGMTLDNFGKIGDQGYYDPSDPDNQCSSNNIWDGTWNPSTNNYKTLVLGNSDATSSPLYVDNRDPKYDPYETPSSNNYGVPYDANILGTINYIVPGTNCSHCTDQGNKVATSTVSGGRMKASKALGLIDSKGNTIAKAKGGTNGKISYEEQIATRTLPIPSADSALRIYVLQQELYSNLIGDSDLQNGNVVFKTFVSNTKNSNIGKFYILDSLLAVTDTTGATNLLSVILPNNTVDNNYLVYYGWMLKTAKGISINADSVAIFNLAKGCPSIDGTVVFAARNMYNNISKRAYNFVDVCSEQEANRKKNVITKTPKNKADELKVFPNPNKGVVNIQLPKKGNWAIVASDLSGRVVWQQNCNGCEGIIKHNFDNSKGLYFIKITNLKTGQQCINKIEIE